MNFLWNAPFEKHRTAFVLSSALAAGILCSSGVNGEKDSRNCCCVWCALLLCTASGCQVRVISQTVKKTIVIWWRLWWWWWCGWWCWWRLPAAGQSLTQSSLVFVYSKLQLLAISDQTLSDWCHFPERKKTALYVVIDARGILVTGRITVIPVTLLLQSSSSCNTEFTQSWPLH